MSAFGVLAAGIAIFVAIAAVGWMLDRPLDAPMSSAAAVGLQGWYLAHGVSLPVSWGVFSVPPLGLTGLLAYLNYRSGRAAAGSLLVRTWARLAESLAAMVIVYVTAAVMLTSAVYPPTGGPGLLDVAFRCGLLTAVAAGAGMVRESGLGAKLMGRLPGPGAAYVRAAAAGGYGVLASAALVVGVALLLSFAEASAITAALAPAGPGGIAIAGLAIGYLPNALLAAAGIGTGATLQLGATSVSLSGSTSGDLPAFPLLAALPDGVGVWGTILIPLSAAVLIGVVLTRRLERAERTTVRLLAGAAAAALLVAMALAGLILFSGGALGDGALASVGVGWWPVAARAAVILTIGAAATALLVSARGLIAAPVAALAAESHGTAAPPSDKATASPPTNVATPSPLADGATVSLPSDAPTASPPANGATGSAPSDGESESPDPDETGAVSPPPDRSGTRAVRRRLAKRLSGAARGPVSTAPAASLSVVQKARAERPGAS